ncbi:MAG: hypothetical protein AAF485_09115 [Chloroflexota bacterium]
MLKQRMINVAVALALLVSAIGSVSLLVDVETVGQMAIPQAIAGHNGNAGGG